MNNTAELYFTVFDWVHFFGDILNMRTCTVQVTSNLISYISISKSSLGMNMPPTTLLNCNCNLINISTLYGRAEINFVSRFHFTPTLSSCPFVLFIRHIFIEGRNNNNIVLREVVSCQGKCLSQEIQSR